MAEIKEQVLGDLYVLRAGLSVISEKADELRAAEDAKDTDLFEKAEDAVAVHRLPEKRGWNHNGFGDAETWVKKNEAHFDGLEEIKETKTRAKDVFVEWLKTDEPLNYFEKQEKAAETAFKSEERKVKIFSAAKIVGIFLFLVGVSAIILNKVLSLGISWLNIVGWITAVFGVAAAVVSVILKRGAADTLDGRKKELYNLSHSVKGIREFQEYARAVMDKDEIKRLKKVSSVIYDELSAAYSQLLDPRDWKYIDLIAFYWETGRAENMKEALQLVEREVQTQRIVGAIEDASARICKTIAVAASAISAQLDTISSQLSQVIANQQIQIGQLDRIIEAENMRNALIAKANVTGEQLMNDVAYIKNYRL